MKTLKPLLLILVLAMAACQPANEASATPTPEAETTPSRLTADALKNAAYIIIENEQPYQVRLTDGRYEYGTDRTAPDYVSISLGDKFSFGDLNGDGLQDAAALLVETYGGTGVFVSVVAVVDEGGLPKHASTAFIDDRPAVNSLEIRGGEILLDAVVHGINDAMCCPTLKQTRTYRLNPRGLVLTHLTTEPGGGSKRVITIESPGDGSEVGRIFPLKGRVSIAPFENTLLVAIFDSLGNQVYTGPIMVDASEMGTPGTFDTSINLEEVEVRPGPIRIEVADVSMADGTYLAMSAVEVVLK